jgi:hypothetical protein
LNQLLIAVAAVVVQTSTQLNSLHQVLLMMLCFPSTYTAMAVLTATSAAVSAATATAAGRAIQRSTPEVCPGDYVKVRLSYFNTPYGDPQLDPVGVPHEVRQKLVWQELAHRMSRGLQVKGRILNPTVKGYAVAVAGYVALLPHDVHKNVQPEQLRQIGVLQDFYVHKMDEQHRRITLSFRNPRSERDMEELYKASMPHAQ